VGKSKSFNQILVDSHRIAAEDDLTLDPFAVTHEISRCTVPVPSSVWIEIRKLDFTTFHLTSRRCSLARRRPAPV
jgi:hypothetical protein